MIIQVRSYLKGKGTKIVLWIVTMVVAFGSLPSIFRMASGGDSWVFRINGQTIGLLEFRRELDKQKSYLSYLRTQYGQYADMLFQHRDISAPTLARTALLQGVLLDQVSRSVGLRVSHDLVAEKLLDPRFLFVDLYGLVPHSVLTDTGIDQKMLSHYLMRKGMSMRDFEQKAEHAVMRNMVIDMIQVSAYTPLFEIKSLYSAYYLDKKFSYLKLNLSDYLAREKQKKVSKEELVTFYENHKNNYEVPEKRWGTVWAIDANAFGITVSDDTIQNYYNRHKDEEFLDRPAQVQVRTILFTVEEQSLRDRIAENAREIREQLVKTPLEFATQAGKISADSDTRYKGGLMSFFAKGEKEPVLERAAFLLSSPGDISDVIETSRGFEIIQLVEKRPRTWKPLTHVKEEIRKILTSRAFKGSFDAEVRKITHDFSENQFSQDAADARVEQFVADKRGRKHTISGADQSGSSAEVKALFSIKSLHGISSYQEGLTGFIVQLISIDKKYTPALEKVEGAVKEDLYKELAKNALEKDLTQAQYESAMVPIKELQDRFGGSSESSDWISMKSDKLKGFLPKNTPLDFMSQMGRVGSTVIRLTEDGGILIKVDALQELDVADFNAKRNGISLQEERQLQQMAVEGYVASLYRNAKIEINNSIPTE